MYSNCDVGRNPDLMDLDALDLGKIQILLIGRIMTEPANGPSVRLT